MTISERFCDLVTGWDLTLKKRSAQITALNMAWQSLVMAAPDILPPLWSNAITLGLMGVTMLASNTTQASVACYDPSKLAVYNPAKYRLVLRGPAR